MAHTNSPERILVLSLAGIGDTLQSTPVLDELRLHFPGARIHAAVVWPGSEQLLRGHPALDAIHQCNLLEVSRTQALRFVLGLRRQHFDLSLTLHPQGRREYRVVTRLAGARIRLSHEYENAGWLDRFLVTHSIPQDYTASGPENNLRLLSLLGLERRLANPSTRIQLTGEERAWAADWETQHGLARRRWIGIHVGSGGTKNLALRRWPPELWADLVHQLAARFPAAAVVAFGGPGEREVHKSLRQQVPEDFLHFPETPDLRHAAALVARAHAFLSVDTAFMHIAAAVRVPHQFVIETPTLNPPVEPFRPDWVRIPNPAVAGRSLEFYRYDGRPIAGTPEALDRIMRSITPEAVMASLGPVLG